MGTHFFKHQFFHTALQQLLTGIDALSSILLQKRRAQLLVVLAVSGVSGAIAYSVNARASTAQHRWTSGASILVTTAVVPKGEMFTSVNTKVVNIPLALRADDALSSLPNSARARVKVSGNTALTQSLVDGANEALAIPDGWRGVALPADVIAPNVVVGDFVDIISNNQVISREALVVESTTTQGITIAVPENDAPVVASASRLGDVSLALTK